MTESSSAKCRGNRNPFIAECRGNRNPFIAEWIFNTQHIWFFLLKTYFFFRNLFALRLDIETTSVQGIQQSKSNNFCTLDNDEKRISLQIAVLETQHERKSDICVRSYQVCFLLLCIKNMCVFFYFEHAINSPSYIASNGRATGEWLTGNDLEGSDRSLICGSIISFT